MAFSMGGTSENESNVGKSAKKPGGPARICGAETTASIGFKKMGGAISDIGTPIEGVVPLTVLAIFAKTEDESCIS